MTRSVTNIDSYKLPLEQWETRFSAKHILLFLVHVSVGLYVKAGRQHIGVGKTPGGIAERKLHRENL